jgi:hypothetical protein
MPPHNNEITGYRIKIWVRIRITNDIEVMLHPDPE